MSHRPSTPWRALGSHSTCLPAVLPLNALLFHPCLTPAVNVYLPKDRVTNNHQGYGFVEFRAEEDADYVSVCCVLWGRG
jgi:RNA recognition motif-containing protein